MLISAHSINSGFVWKGSNRVSFPVPGAARIALILLVVMRADQLVVARVDGQWGHVRVKEWPGPAGKAGFLQRQALVGTEMAWTCATSWSPA